MTTHKSLILLFYHDSASRRKGSTVSLPKANRVFRKDKVKSQEQRGSQLMSPAGLTERSRARTGFAPQTEGNAVPQSPPRHAADTLPTRAASRPPISSPQPRGPVTNHHRTSSAASGFQIGGNPGYRYGSQRRPNFLRRRIAPLLRHPLILLRPQDAPRRPRSLPPSPAPRLHPGA